MTAATETAETIETTSRLEPEFDAQGLVTAIVADAATGEILRVAHMNAEALAKTVETRQAWFWSRSRRQLWRKGETSGNALEVVELRVDCDQDAVLLKVKIGGDGVACHTGSRSCFYRSVPLDAPLSDETRLIHDDAMPRVDQKGRG